MEGRPLKREGEGVAATRNGEQLEQLRAELGRQRTIFYLKALHMEACRTALRKAELELSQSRSGVEQMEEEARKLAIMMED